MVTIRPMTLEDIPAVIRVWQETATRSHEADRPEVVRRFLDRNPGLCQVAEHAGTILGVVICGHDGRRGHLHHVGVIQTFRRHGVGRKMVETAFGALRQVGITRVHLQLKQSNILGLRFWKGLGCRERSDTVVVSIQLPGSTDGGADA